MDLVGFFLLEGMIPAIKAMTEVHLGTCGYADDGTHRSKG